MSISHSQSQFVTLRALYIHHPQLMVGVGRVWLSNFPFVYISCLSLQPDSQHSDQAVDVPHQQHCCLTGSNSLHYIPLKSFHVQRPSTRNSAFSFPRTLTSSEHIYVSDPPPTKMGTLTDITAKANNAIKRQSGDMMASQALNSPASSENLGKSKSPHFMTPTVASSKQSVPSFKKAYDSTVTPSSLTSSKGSGWMASAAKRVGINRTGDPTPRPRKEDHSKHPKTPSALTFPDKVRDNRFCRVSVLTKINTNLMTSWLYVLTGSFQTPHFRVQPKLQIPS